MKCSEMSMMQGESDLVQSREVMIRRGGAGEAGRG